MGPDPLFFHVCSPLMMKVLIEQPLALPGSVSYIIWLIVLPFCCFTQRAIAAGQVFSTWIADYPVVPQPFMQDRPYSRYEMLIKEALLMKDFWTIEEHRLPDHDPYHCVDHGYGMYFSLRPGVPKLCGGRGRKLKYTLRERGFMHHCPQHCQQILGFGYCDTLMVNCDRYLEIHLKSSLTKNVWKTSIIGVNQLQ